MAGEILACWQARDGSKYLSIAELAAVVAGSQRNGKRVVLTNGCFDLLHAGHIRLLQQASALGDVLVVALNTDTSVRRLKGPGRPIIPLEQRVQVIQALDCVDYLVAFEEDTPLELLAVLRPDVLVKGGDYTSDTIVGRELVESYGGQVKTVPLFEGVSTTKVVQQIRELG